MKSSTVKVLLLTLFAGSVGIAAKAQKTSPEPIFGSTVIHKKTSDSTKKKAHTSIFRPAFLRIGTLGGLTIPFDKGTDGRIGGAMNLRVEYGFSNFISLVGVIQRNGSNGLTFQSMQTSLGVNFMPIKSKRLQPYFGASVGLGGNGGNRNSRNQFDWDNDRSNDPFNNPTGERRHATAFGQIRMGLNYVLAKRFIATLETAYQMPLSNTSTSGGQSIMAGFAYQFGKHKSK